MCNSHSETSTANERNAREAMSIDPTKLPAEPGSPGPRGERPHAPITRAGLTARNPPAPGRRTVGPGAWLPRRSNRETHGQALALAVPPGVPAQVDVDAHASLKDLMVATCARYGDRPAYRSMGTALSFRQLDEASRAFAGGWTGRWPCGRRSPTVKAVVVRKDPALTQAELLAHCRQHLTGYKLPRVIEFRDQPLPKTAVGKILRREVRDGAGGTTAEPGKAPEAKPH